MPEVPITGTVKEIELFTDVHRHYQLAEEDLKSRTPEFDRMDKLFRSHISPSSWPYRSLVFDPRVFTALFEKTARILANKPRGRVIPREGGDVLKAKIINELLSFQWDDNERADSMSMLAKWSMMDLNARKYGASFGLVKWHWEKHVYGKEKKSKVFFDGPNFKPLMNRDCLPNPSYSQIKNWFQHREYVTLQELMDVNDSARSEPVYKNLEVLRDLLKQEAKKVGDSRATNYTVQNKALKGITDFLGQDEVYKVVEVVTEYRPERWITFSPKHGVILRDIPNPYSHCQIPVVMLKYYPVDDDLYGLSEIEPVEKLQKAINAILCQYLDSINMSLYTPLKVRSTGVQMHTLEFGPGKKWIMNDPSSDVITHDQSINGVQEFTATYRFLVGAMQEALGEASATASGADPGQADKTATEIKDTAYSRNARDNFNQLFLGDAIKKQMMFWHVMDQQFLFSNPSEQNKIITIVGKDAINYFQSAGLNQTALSDQTIEMLKSPEMDGLIAEGGVNMQEMESPIYPAPEGSGMESKFEFDELGNVGKLFIEPDDLAGTYDYIPDVGSMNSNASDDMTKAKALAIEQITSGGIGQMIMQEGNQIKMTDMAVDYWEDVGFKNADQYIKKMPNNPMMGGMYGAQPGGAVVPQTGGAVAGNAGNQGMAGGISPLPQGQA